ncbi:hypothetical protein mRhiFer1_009200 [Rhinolophus ferrumequinum]|uniref:Uncharacterized protein n=1 Tax=Rhinolophus ferrumequinum TaxID=59479 RepID=A0A7J7SJL4_RHIFE|nr:hypothetical protein mRhiFer1_009200 [Rhinolophus ferrumequinum]
MLLKHRPVGKIRERKTICDVWQHAWAVCLFPPPALGAASAGVGAPRAGAVPAPCLPPRSGFCGRPELYFQRCPSLVQPQQPDREEESQRPQRRQERKGGWRAGRRRLERGGAAAAAREDGSPAAASPLSEPLAHGGS